MNSASAKNLAENIVAAIEPIDPTEPKKHVGVSLFYLF
jgi:hypothetical protein